jgi:hypothetical protein
LKESISIVSENSLLGAIFKLGSGSRDLLRHIQLEFLSEDGFSLLDTNGNIFHGFTLLKWDSHYGWKGDDSLKSFLFTLKNPHNIPSRRFALNGEANQLAIECDSECGPIFGAARGIAACDDRHSGTKNSGDTNDPDWTGTSFSRVHSISKLKKLNSLRSQTKQHFHAIFVKSGEFGFERSFKGNPRFDSKTIHIVK